MLMSGARVFISLRVGGVFHVKSMCLSVFDMFLLSYFANTENGLWFSFLEQKKINDN
jgi:hypothetical protein